MIGNSQAGSSSPRGREDKLQMLMCTHHFRLTGVTSECMYTRHGFICSLFGHVLRKLPFQVCILPFMFYSMLGVRIGRLELNKICWDSMGLLMIQLVVFRKELLCSLCGKEIYVLLTRVIGIANFSHAAVSTISHDNLRCIRYTNVRHGRGAIYWRIHV